MTVGKIIALPFIVVWWTLKTAVKTLWFVIGGWLKFVRVINNHNIKRENELAQRNRNELTKMRLYNEQTKRANGEY